MTLSAVIAAIWWFLTRPIIIILGLLVRVPLGLWALWERKVDRFSFRPPRRSRLLIWLAKGLKPTVSRRLCKTESFEVDSADLERLGQLRGERVVVCPNHPTGLDPLPVFHLGSLLDEDFNYLACRESFFPPPKGWLMQRLGCYSVLRGTPDRESFRMTRELLAAGERWIVMFPEGESCGHSDSVLPFHEGVVQMAFWGLDELAEKGDPPPVFLLPVGLRYTYTRDMRPVIARSLRALERKLSLPDEDSDLDPDALYGRLRRIGDAVLSAMEKEHGVRPAKDASLDDRVQHFKEVLIDHIAGQLGVKLRSGDTLLDRMRALFNAADRVVYEEPTGSAYKRELHIRRVEEVRTVYDDLRRVRRFVALYDGYVRETMTAERFLDVLGLLEWEVFGKLPVYGPRRATLAIGEPINLAEHWHDYQQDKRNVVSGITLQLESSVKLLLAAMRDKAQRLED